MCGNKLSRSASDRLCHTIINHPFRARVDRKQKKSVFCIIVWGSCSTDTRKLSDQISVCKAFNDRLWEFRFAPLFSPWILTQPPYCRAEIISRLAKQRFYLCNWISESTVNQPVSWPVGAIHNEVLTAVFKRHQKCAWHRFDSRISDHLFV